MPSLGSALLALAFLAALAAAALALAGRHGDRRRVDLSRRAVYLFCGLVTACVAIVEIAFAGDDFSFNIVA
jgi:cytochrome c biogenesis factor